DATDKDEIHKIIRGISRRCAIAYEQFDGTMQYDEAEDPLPFDTEADVIEIEDRDYALWYRDMAEEMKKYIGKTVKFKGIVAVSDKFPEGTVVCGRHVMTCCVDDIEFKGIITRLPKGVKLRNRDWIIITAKFTREFHKLYRGKGPILTVTDMALSSAPEQEVATFY
ncbi:MAG: GTPase, partial [Clostridia bacterium]|nr:GTPase [Clostridia bacterium]